MKRLNQFLRVALHLTFAMLMSNANASVLLATTDLTFSASGSPNNIAGTWSAPSLDVNGDEVVDYFKLEVLANDSAFGAITSLGFISYFPSDSRGLSFGANCPIGFDCVGTPEVGSVSFLDVLSGNQAGARDFLFRLIANDQRYRYTSDGPVTVGFNNGGGYATASGMVRVSAYGIASPVPEPATNGLVISGLCLMVFILRRRNSLR